jgi:uncharacterized membrane protein YidH (DUF202 family)
VISAKEPDLRLAITLVVAGAIALIISIAEFDMTQNDNLGKETLASICANAFFVAAVGVTVAIRICLRSRRETKNPASGGLFFPELEPSILGPNQVTGREDVDTQRKMNPVAKALLYILSAFEPALGSLVGGLLSTSVTPNYRHVGRVCMIISVVFLIVITALVGLVFAAVHS